MPCKFYYGKLHAQANTKKGNIVFSAVADGFYLTFNPPIAKTSRYENAIYIIEGFSDPFLAYLFRVNEFQVYLRFIGETTVKQGLIQTLVRVH